MNDTRKPPIPQYGEEHIAMVLKNIDSYRELVEKRMRSGTPIAGLAMIGAAMDPADSVSMFLPIFVSEPNPHTLAAAEVSRNLAIMLASFDSMCPELQLNAFGAISALFGTVQLPNYEKGMARAATEDGKGRVVRELVTSGGAAEAGVGKKPN